MKPIECHKTVTLTDEKIACDFLATHSGLSKSKIKDAMTKGAVWLTQPKKKPKRLRRATTQLHEGDVIDLYYDETILKTQPATPLLIADRAQYSVWFKPAGLLAQGTRYGDHVSLLRQVELHFAMRRQVYLVHRLDREATGLMLVAHKQKTAAQLSRLFNSNQIDKQYRVEVFGNIPGGKEPVVMEAPIEEKPATTEYRVIQYDTQQNTSVLDVVIKTGRKHQIRRHLAGIGHPVMGDPAYGKNNKTLDGMKLCAVRLRFVCPVDNKSVEYHVTDAEKIFLHSENET